MSSPRRGTLLLLLLGAAASAAVAAALYVRSAERAGAGALRPGEAVPGFEAETLDGVRVSLASLRGKVVYVHFWATWCAPCRDEAPALERLYQNLHPEGFELVALSIDDLDKAPEVLAFRDEFRLSFPILRDPERVVYSRYGATGVPETYLVDSEGQLAEAYIGPRDWDEARYARTVRRLLERRDEGRAGE